MEPAATVAQPPQEASTVSRGQPAAWVDFPEIQWAVDPEEATATAAAAAATSTPDSAEEVAGQAARTSFPALPSRLILQPVAPGQVVLEPAAQPGADRPAWAGEQRVNQDKSPSGSFRDLHLQSPVFRRRVAPERVERP